jgi:L,D-transpeptidase YbiS
MAMKKWIFIVSTCIVVLVGAAIMIIMFSFGPPEVELRSFGDSVLTSLPADDKAAQAELRKIRKAYDAMRPGGSAQAGKKKRPSSPGMPPDMYIVINTHANEIYLRTEDSVLFKATCSTGTGGELVDTATGRHWVFDTPRGSFKISSKLKEPWWRKPDWAFIEEGEDIPKQEAERYDKEMMGDYALGFGDGFFIHGTIYERLLGINVTHGCVRVGSADLQHIFDNVGIGTKLYIF